MSEQEPTANRTDAPTRVDDRYAATSFEDGTVVVYDRENDRAWLESTAAVALEEVR